MALRSRFGGRWLRHPLLHKYTRWLREDLSRAYSRDIRKWLLVAPIIGVVTGLVITGIAFVILDGVWGFLLPLYLAHPWVIVPGLSTGFLATGLLMQYGTPDPDEHSTEEIIRSYHEHLGDIDVRPFWIKLAAAVTTVGSGGSAALEGPSIYGGGAIGSWLWTRLGRLGLTPRDRRIMLISGAAAGMAAVFRAPLTGLVFALEMPYRDDLAHEALVPALIASVVAYATLVSFMGATPLFGFRGSTSFVASDLAWAALLGLGCGIVAMGFTLIFRRVRRAFVNARIPHTGKLLIGGLGTALCGLLFISIFPGRLIPLGPNYEAANEILRIHHGASELVAFAGLKLAATLFSLGSGGVSAMFVPLFLSGGALGRAFGQAIVHTQGVDLYAAVGMASFLAAGYKAPLTAVVFVAETTGGHAYLIPALIGAACAYAISGEASASGDQRLHEAARIAELAEIEVGEVMRRDVVAVPADATLREFAEGVASRSHHSYFPVSEGTRTVGILPWWVLSRIGTDHWDDTRAGESAERAVAWVRPDCDLMEALRLLTRENALPLLLVGDAEGLLAGVVTKTDILNVLGSREREDSWPS
jgi:CIC family chloride channel protein